MNSLSRQKNTTASLTSARAISPKIVSFLCRKSSKLSRFIVKVIATAAPFAKRLKSFRGTLIAKQVTAYSMWLPFKIEEINDSLINSLPQS